MTASAGIHFNLSDTNPAGPSANVIIALQRSFVINQCRRFQPALYQFGEFQSQRIITGTIGCHDFCPVAIRRPCLRLCNSGCRLCLLHFVHECQYASVEIGLLAAKRLNLLFNICKLSGIGDTALIKLLLVRFPLRLNRSQLQLVVLEIAGQLMKFRQLLM